MKNTTKTTIKNPSMLVKALLGRVAKQNQENQNKFWEIMAKRICNTAKASDAKHIVETMLENNQHNPTSAQLVLDTYRDWLKECNIKPLAYYRKRRHFTKATSNVETLVSDKKATMPRKETTKQKIMKDNFATLAPTKSVVVKGATVEIDCNGNYILKANSKLEPMSDFAKQNLPKLVQVRNAICDSNGVVLSDYTCSSGSQCASLIYGCSKSGNVVFKQQQNAPRNTQAKQQKQTNQNNANLTQQPASNATTINCSGNTVEIEIKQEKQEKPVEQPKVVAKNNDKLDQFKIECVDKIKKFCKDFEYNPDARIINSLYYESDPTQYLLDTMRLTFSKNYDEVIEKAEQTFKKVEWQNLIKDFKSCSPTHSRTNERLDIYFGSAGTGKTESACFEYGVKTKINANNPNFVENPKVKKIVANRTQDPADLFTYFDPKTKQYELTEISVAMNEGNPIIIDEANLYSQPVWQRLQGVLDNTSSVSERGITINIKDGFKVIATLNLETNVDGKRPLPNPIVSRAKTIRNYDSEELIKKSYAYIL